jgi:hypothetical protein
MFLYIVYIKEERKKKEFNRGKAGEKSALPNTR